MTPRERAMDRLLKRLKRQRSALRVEIARASVPEPVRKAIEEAITGLDRAIAYIEKTSAD